VLLSCNTAQEEIRSYDLCDSLQLIKFVQTNKEKLMSTKEEDNGKNESNEDYGDDEVKDQIKEETREQKTTNKVF
jgi:hypothetical protein